MYLSREQLQEYPLESFDAQYKFLTSVRILLMYASSSSKGYDYFVEHDGFSVLKFVRKYMRELIKPIGDI